ncbi:uncharacterized protein BXIN_0916 [Babesia sp. Xinjiang]|uniref:uncharacterized protein n=1 Tax=Babesia sp. Xinjiang TaxID=462227 RepID=UPI000A24BA98|nr:uncharacterized protein BXIN_0916 [Babesia sp. Xinjiang]ORM42045.1 hypothetical protein BXIN_0916 [Babesia sp. Xinjiang]
MRICISRTLFQRIGSLKCEKYLPSVNCDFAEFPERLLAILPGKKHKTVITRYDYDGACKLAQCVEGAAVASDLFTHIIKDHGAWIAAVQRAQMYGIRLVTPLRLINNAFDDGKLKLRGLSSREFATLASVCAIYRTDETESILNKMCDPELLRLVLPDMTNSDYALFLNALARTKRMQRLHEKTVEQELAKRITTMSTFDIALTFDVLSALRKRHQNTAKAAVERFTTDLEKSASCDQLRRYMKVKVPVKGTVKAGTAQRMLLPLVNDITLFLRALVRADQLGADDMDHIAKICAYLFSAYKEMEGTPEIVNERVVANSTTILMCLCCLAAKIGNLRQHTATLDNAIVQIFHYLRQEVALEMFSVKERTKLCLAVQTYWHLADVRRHVKLLHDIYTNIVRPDDRRFLAVLDYRKDNHTGETSSYESITNEVYNCLARISSEDAYRKGISKVTVPPYVISIIYSNTESVL